MFNPLEAFVIGTSDATEAEYGYRSDSAITVICLFDGEYSMHLGFDTVADAKTELGDAPISFI